jgi:hypothetical protein
MFNKLPAQNVLLKNNTIYQGQKTKNLSSQFCNSVFGISFFAGFVSVKA